jgi:hypothetical protein
MQTGYIEFNGKHPKDKKEDRKYQQSPDKRWTSFGCRYSDRFLKVDIDDLDHKTGEPVETISGKMRSDVVVEILDALKVRYNGIRTEHGKHLFFRKPEGMFKLVGNVAKDKNKSDWYCPIGIRMEWKLPTSDDHIPLQINGIKREFFKGRLENEDIDDLPFWLYPMQKSKNKPVNLEFKEGDRTQPLGGYLFQLALKGFTADECFKVVELMNQYVFEQPIPDEDLYAQILNESTHRKLQDTVTEAEKKEVSIEAFSAFLDELGIRLQYNDLLNRVEFVGVPSEWEIHDEMNQMPIELQYRFRKYSGNKSFTKNACIDLMSRLADRNTYNPVKDYLDPAVSGVKWDKKDRFPELFDILGIDDDFEQSLIRKWFYQTAYLPFNTVEAGCGAEGVLVLKGAEGIGKSRFFAQLMPNNDWFSSLDKELSTKNKDILIQMLGEWIGEIGELDRTFEANKSDLKNFTTLTKDTIRKPYAREPVTKARITSFCGTTNKEEFLDDDTGARRWWIIRISDVKDMTDFIQKDNLHQFWAQCYETVMADPLCFRLKQIDRNKLVQRNLNFTKMIPCEEELLNRLDFDAPDDQWDWIYPYLLTTMPEYDVQKQDPRNVGKALIAIMGLFPKIKRGKRTARGIPYWLPPAVKVTGRNRKPK